MFRERQLQFAVQQRVGSQPVEVRDQRIGLRRLAQQFGSPGRVDLAGLRMFAGGVDLPEGQVPGEARDALRGEQLKLQRPLIVARCGQGRQRRGQRPESIIVGVEAVHLGQFGQLFQFGESPRRQPGQGVVPVGVEPANRRSLDAESVQGAGNPKFRQIGRRVRRSQHHNHQEHTGGDLSGCGPGRIRRCGTVRPPGCDFTLHYYCGYHLLLFV